MLWPKEGLLDFHRSHAHSTSSLPDGCANGKGRVSNSEAALVYLPLKLNLCFSSQGELYVMGGSNGHSDELSCGEMYNPKIDEWIQVPELRTNRCNSGKHHFLLGNVLNICYLFEWAFSVRSWRLKIKEPIMPVLVGTVKEWIILIIFSSQVCVRCKTSFLWWEDLTLVAKRAWGIVTHLTQWQKCGPAAHPSTSVCQFSFMFWNDFNLKKP